MPSSPRATLTCTVDAERALFSGRYADAAARQGALAAAAVAFVGHVVGVRTMRHSI
ncbi:MAG TPA: hypothetical protein VIK31_00895 [Propionibacteriaceae bacterium]